MPLRLLEGSGVGSDAESLRGAARIPIRRDRGEREDVRHPERAALLHQPLAKRELARRRLRLAQEDDDLPPARGISPEKEPAARQARRVEEVDRRRRRDLTQPGPSRDEPSLWCLGHGLISRKEA